MNRSSYLKLKTRDPAFLWRLVIWIIALGFLLGAIAQYWFQPHSHVDFKPKSTQNQWQHIEQYAQEGQWSKVWWAIPTRMLASFKHTGPTVLAVIAGCCWLMFLLHAMHVHRLRNSHLWLATAAVALGMLSVWPTLFFLFWQEHGWQLQDSPELIPALRYNILGIGLREELAKLLCLLPLMPLLIKQRSELTILLVSACVGLGFAVEENIGYFAMSQGQAAVGRFLTANPFHMALTGLIGLAVSRAIRYPRDWAPQAVATFGIMVFAHGMYDAAMSIPALVEYNIVSSIIFILTIYQFFRELRQLRTKTGDTISLTAVFLAGVSVVVAATFVYLSATIGCQAAIDSLVSSILTMSVMVYLFLREMPETMVTV